MNRLWPLLLAVPALIAQQQPTSHVRVIQDTSLSLFERNDKGRLAVLATALLRDLAWPSLGVEGSFEVITFDRNLRWTDTSSPPIRTGRRLSTNWSTNPRGNGPDAFLADLFSLPYDAKMTYFYPGLKAAIDDLEKAPGRRDARRVIVIVTDGLPEAQTRAKEEEWIERDLVPRLVKPVSGRIQVFVLAFGPEASNNLSFFQKLTSPGGLTLGEVQPDPDGRQMLVLMTRIFTSGFGYIAEEAPDPTRIPLKHAAAERAAVVSYWDSTLSRPTFDLTPLTAVSYNFSAADALAGAHPGSKAAYALRWVLSPQQRGDGRASGFRGSPRFAILRPTEVRLSIEPSTAGQRHDLALAGRPLNMKIRARNVSGAQAAPAEGLDTSYEILIPKTGGQRDEYARVPSRDSQHDFGTVPTGNPYREYDVSITFPGDAVPGREYYIGIVEAQATRGQSIVSSLRWPDAHRVTVYPNVSMVPLPEDGDVKKGGRIGPIGRFESGWCADFHFEVVGGLNESRPYSLRAVLDPQQPLPAGLELHLDEDRITQSRLQTALLATGERPQDWYNGVPLKPDQMRGDHHLCVSTTKHNSGMQLSVPVRFTLEEFPYSYFDVVKPFSVRLTLAAPDFWDRWSAALTVLLLLLLLLLLAWLLRFLPKVAPDFGFAGTSVCNEALPVFRHLAPEPVVGWFFPAERAVVSDGNMLGWIRPREADLYEFRPVEAGVLEDENSGEWSPLKSERRKGKDYYTVAVGRAYSWRARGRTEHFQLEFERP